VRVGLSYDPLRLSPSSSDLYLMRKLRGIRPLGRYRHPPKTKTPQPIKKPINQTKTPTPMEQPPWNLKPQTPDFTSKRKPWSENPELRNKQTLISKWTQNHFYYFKYSLLGSKDFS